MACAVGRQRGAASDQFGVSQQEDGQQRHGRNHHPARRQDDINAMTREPSLNEGIGRRLERGHAEKKQGPPEYP